MHSPTMQTGNSERQSIWGLVFIPSYGVHWHQVESRKLRLLRVHRTNTDSAGFVIGCAAGAPL